MDSRNCDVTTGYFRVKCVPSSGTLRIYVRVSDEPSTFDNRNNSAGIPSFV